MYEASSLDQIAKILDVSVATVADAFNRPEQLSSALREHILSECRRLNYKGPSFVECAYQAPKSEVVGVMLADSLSYIFSDPMASEVMQGVSEVLTENAKQLLLLCSAANSEQHHRAELLPDAFLFYGAPQGENLERLLKLGKPCVTVDFTYGSLPSVNVDNYAVSRKLAKHAVRSSHDIVAVIGMRLLNIQSIKRLNKTNLIPHSKEISWQRLLGFSAGCSEKGVNLEPENIIHINENKADKAEIAARMLLMQEKRPTVILCMSDVIALAVTRAAKALKVPIPSMLRVTGFDNIIESQHSNPSITTVSQSGIEKGRLAAQMLLDNKQGQISLALDIVVRESA